MPPDFSPVDYAIPGFIILILAEIWVAKRRDPTRYEARDTLTSLLLGTGSTVAGALTGGAVMVLAMWLYQHRLFDIIGTFGWVWWVWALCFLLDDLAYYWAHRTGHRVRWFWASHITAASTIICRPRCAKAGPALSRCRSSFASRWPSLAFTRR